MTAASWRVFLSGVFVGGLTVIVALIVASVLRERSSHPDAESRR